MLKYLPRLNCQTLFAEPPLSIHLSAIRLYLMNRNRWTAEIQCVFILPLQLQIIVNTYVSKSDPHSIFSSSKIFIIHCYLSWIYPSETEVYYTDSSTRYWSGQKIAGSASPVTVSFQFSDETLLHRLDWTVNANSIELVIWLWIHKVPIQTLFCFPLVDTAFCFLASFRILLTIYFMLK